MRAWKSVVDALVAEKPEFVFGLVAVCKRTSWCGGCHYSPSCWVEVRPIIIDPLKS